MRFGGNPFDQGDQSRFILAAQAGNPQAIYDLLRAGENVNQADSKGQTSLHAAAKQGNRRIVLLLLENGANPNAATKMGETPLHFAAMNGHDECVHLLIDSGADATIPDGFGELPLSYAEFRGHDSTTSRLLPASVPKNTTPEDLFGAIDKRDIATLELMLRAGFSPNTFLNGTYPLHYAIRKKHAEAVMPLLKGGADLTLRSKGSQPLHCAADIGMEPVVRYLLRYNPDVNDRNTNNGNTPLHYACYKGNINVLTILMKHGADPNITNFSGQTPVTMAMQSPSTDILQAMISGGLLKRSKPDYLLQAAIASQKPGIAMMICVMLQKSWSPMHELRVNPKQASLICARDNNTSLHVISDSLAANKTQTAWSALDSM